MSTAYWAVVPAAGVGRRMGASRPKQYLEVAGRAIIEHTLGVLCDHPRIAGVVVVLAGGDPWWGDIAPPGPTAPLVAAGGAERCHSVLSGLLALEAVASGDDWVLVHDAARPCVSGHDIDALIEGVGPEDLGGLLGVPLGDTLKRVGTDGSVTETVPRQGLWRALTPQMFRLQGLRDALRQCVAQGMTPTDECQAMELFGRSGAGTVRMIEGLPTNIKVTRAGNLSLVAQYFHRLEEGRVSG